MAYTGLSTQDFTASYEDIAAGAVKPYSAAQPDVVAQDYFNNLLDITERQYSGQKQQIEESYSTLIKQMKESRELFNQNLESDYGKALEEANVNIYERGIEDSGLRGEEIGGITAEKQSKEEQQQLLEAQKQEIANQERQQRLEDLSLQQQSARLGIQKSASSPYAKYSYL